MRDQAVCGVFDQIDRDFDSSAAGCNVALDPTRYNEDPDDAFTAPAVRGYSRVKGLVIHGYFTSERVQRDVLKTEIMPGRFDGAADMPARNGGRDE